MSTGVELIPADEIRAALIDMAEAKSVTSEQVQQDIVRRILEAKTIEEAAADFTATPAEDIEGVGVTVTGLAWLKSTYKEGPPVYALIRCVPDNTKAELTVSLGGRSAMAFLLWCQEHKSMPFRCAFVRSAPNQTNGNRYWTVKLNPGTSK